MKVRDVMTRGVEWIDESKTVADAMEVMRRHHITSLIVKPKGTGSLGILTRRDVVNKVVADGKDPKKLKLTDAATFPLVTVKLDATIREAAKLMKRLEIRRFPVEDDEAIVGMVSNSDVFRSATAKLKDASKRKPK